MTGSIRKNLRRVGTVARREIGYRFAAPREAGIELTYRCNLRCRMCGVIGKIRDGQDAELSVGEYGDLFAQMKAMGIGLVTFTGGEPFVRKDLFDIVREAKSRGIGCNIFTNGTLVCGDILERIFESGIDKLIFSVDGINDVHDSIRGLPGSFVKVFGALSNLASMRRARGTTRPEIDAHMTLTGANVESLSALSRLCRSLGVPLSYQPYSESSEGSFRATMSILDGVTANRYLPRDATLRFSDGQLRRLGEELGKMPADFYSKLLCSFSREELKRGVMPLRKCYFTRSFLMIDPYGNVFPCTNLDSYRVGNVRSEKLADIWSGEKYGRLREKLSRRLLPLCASCCHCADNLSFAQLVRIVAGRGAEG